MDRKRRQHPVARGPDQAPHPLQRQLGSDPLPDPPLQRPKRPARNAGLRTLIQPAPGLGTLRRLQRWRSFRLPAPSELKRLTPSHSVCRPTRAICAISQRLSLTSIARTIARRCRACLESLQLRINAARSSGVLPVYVIAMLDGMPSSLRIEVIRKMQIDGAGGSPHLAAKPRCCCDQFCFSTVRESLLTGIGIRSPMVCPEELAGHLVALLLRMSGRLRSDWL